MKSSAAKGSSRPLPRSHTAILGTVSRGEYSTTVGSTGTATRPAAERLAGAKAMVAELAQLAGNPVEPDDVISLDTPIDLPEEEGEDGFFDTSGDDLSAEPELELDEEDK